jgi:hypothetical protein
VYATTADDVRELRDIIEDVLMEDESFLNRKEVETAVSNVEGLLLVLLRKTWTAARKPPAPKCFKCAGSNKVSSRNHEPYCDDCLLPWVEATL